jgi:predicted exporter
VAAWVFVPLHGLSFDAAPSHLRPSGERLEEKLSSLGEGLGFSPIGSLVLCPTDTPLETLAEVTRSLEERGLVGYSSGPQRTVATVAQRAEVARFREAIHGWETRTREAMREVGFEPQAFESSLAEWSARFATDPVPTTEDECVEWDGRRWWQLSLHPPVLPRGAVDRRAWRNSLREAFPASTEVIDTGLVADRLGPRIERDLARSAWICALAVSLLVLAAMRRARETIIALVPVACGLGLTLATAELAGWSLNLGNFIAVPLILGLGVDDGIHMTLRLREHGRRAISTTGKAIWRTSVTTGLGFGSLITARSPALASLGTLVLVGIAASFLASILLVPVLFQRTETK